MGLCEVVFRWYPWLMKSLIIYTDGSCLGNPGPGGWGAIIKDGQKETVLSGGEDGTTNNRMEMMAVIEALKWVSEHDKDREIQVYSDSSLIINTLNDDWKRKTNGDLWAALDEARAELKIEWNWVKGHAGTPLNERCDQLAVAEAEKVSKKTPKDAPKSAKTTSHDDGLFVCAACGTASIGLLGYMSDSDMIRVDCPHCGRYIKFASPTPENLDRAKKRPLVTKDQLEKFKQKASDEGAPLSERQVKNIKRMTQDEATVTLEAEQTLF